MSRILASTVAVLICCLLPAGVGAQGVLGSFLTGWETVARPFEDLKLDVAYLTYTNPVFLGFDGEGPPLPGIDLGRLCSVRYSLRGLWLGVSATANVGDRFGLVAGGTWLVPDNGEAEERRTVNGAEMTQRTTTRTQWYTLDAYAFWPFSGPCRGLAGFRYDELATRFEDAITDFLVIPALDSGDSTVNSFIPYVGVAVGEGRGLRLSVIASPIVWGDVRYRGPISMALYQQISSGPFSSGYFAEAWIDYGVNVMGARVSLLAKWTCLHATGTSQRPGQFIGGPLSDSYRSSFDRQNWMLGGSFSIPLASPL